MNTENREKLWKEILSAGDYLKNKFDESYKDISDEKFNLVIEYIDFLKKNPS